MYKKITTPLRRLPRWEQLDRPDYEEYITISSKTNSIHFSAQLTAKLFPLGTLLEAHIDAENHFIRLVEVDTETPEDISLLRTTKAGGFVAVSNSVSIPRIRIHCPLLLREIGIPEDTSFHSAVSMTKIEGKKAIEFSYKKGLKNGNVH